MANFTIDMAARSETSNSKAKVRLYKQNMMRKFMEIKSKEPKLTRKEISKQLGFSGSTNERYRDNIIMYSLYNRNNYKKKNNKSNTSITQIQAHKPSENAKNNKNNRNIKKNGVKVGSF